MLNRPDRWVLVGLIGLVAVISACSMSAQSAGDGDRLPPLGSTEPSDDTTTTTVPGAGPSSSDSPTSTAASTTSTSTTTTSTTTTTTTTVPELDVYDPECVVEVGPGESLTLIADRFDDDTVNAATVRAENHIVGDVIYPGQLLDVCVGNGLDDVTGEERPEPNAAIVTAEMREAVEAQQEKLNELFDGYGIAELLVDGDSGRVTRQRLCAARLALGLPVTLEDMEPGSDEEAVLFAAEELGVPDTSATASERWILIDQTCQIMFVGAGPDELVFVFPTSTGEPGHETRGQDRTPMFRYNSASDNNGWHNSTTFPVEDDNPLNGNMYRPLYFDRGQAIHGANNVPTTPQSKGCARLRVEHQDALVAWLGLDDITGQTTSRDRLNVTVNVQGAYPH